MSTYRSHPGSWPPSIGKSLNLESSSSLVRLISLAKANFSRSRTSRSLEIASSSLRSWLTLVLCTSSLSANSRWTSEICLVLLLLLLFMLFLSAVVSFVLLLLLLLPVSADAPGGGNFRLIARLRSSASFFCSAIFFILSSNCANASPSSHTSFSCVPTLLTATDPRR